MKKFLVFLMLVAAALVVAQVTGLVHLPVPGAKPAQGGGGPRRALQSKVDEPPVLTVAVTKRDVPVTQDAVGTVQALNSVVVRPQVDGKLIELNFKDGQDVKKGDVLARIDPVTYQAQYDQAVAKKAQDMAQLANARIDLDRYDKLAASNYGSKQQADTQRSLVAQLEAQTRNDQASIDNSKAILDYTTIIAPMSGRTGIRSVDVGNIVHASDTTGIVSITQVRPIAAIFNLPQQQLRAVSAGMARGPMQVQALADDNKAVTDTGVVDVIDNLVDTTTGTVRVKVTFPNDGNALWPGQFTNMRLLIDTLSQATVVPTAAVQRGPNGPYVFVVGDDNKAVLTAVVVGRQDEQQAVILSGVAPPARVVTTGFALITDGMVVNPTAQDSQSAPGNAATPAQPRPDAGGRRQGGGGGQGGRRQGGGGGPNPAPAQTGAPPAGAAAAPQ